MNNLTSLNTTRIKIQISQKTALHARPGSVNARTSRTSARQLVRLVVNFNVRMFPYYIPSYVVINVYTHARAPVCC